MLPLARVFLHRKFPHYSICSMVVGILVLLATGRAFAQSDDALRELSLEELADVAVTSVSKTAEPLRRAAASIYVISREDILRSGASNLPEMLRLAPNLQVAQTGSGAYNISARGFSGNPQAQNFSNKLLVLIDGRSVYTPLFSGVYWDMQDVLPVDIDRIEVISGPGATQWGANAVNGVINVITRSAVQSQGGFVSVGGGNLQRRASARYGGEIGSNAAFRIYGDGFRRDAAVDGGGVALGDEWSKSQTGFRVDWAQALDAVTLQGDAYQGTEQQPSPGDTAIKGGNILGRWRHTLHGSGSLQVQAYVDHMQRYNTGDDSGFNVRTYDLDVQHSFEAGPAHAITWGGGYRENRYSIDPAASLAFDPARRSLGLGNAFLQDAIKLSPALKLTLGMKFEKGSESGFERMPSVRLTWDVTQHATLWSSVSRAARAATPFDLDVVEKLGSLIYLTGNKNFKNENVVAYQIGYRADISPQLSISMTTFYNQYHDLRSIELSAGGLPLHWGNAMEGTTYGVEVWSTYAATEWWRLSVGASGLRKNLEFEADSSKLLGVSAAGNDAPSQASLRSSFDLSDTVAFDATIRAVHALPDPQVPGYVDLNARLGWKVHPNLALSLAGYNLLRSRHQEFTAPQSSAVQRGLFAEAQWMFE